MNSPIVDTTIIRIYNYDLDFTSTDFSIAVVSHQLRPLMGGDLDLSFVYFGGGLFRTAYFFADFRVIPFGIRELQPGFTHDKHLVSSLFHILLQVSRFRCHKPVQLCILRELIYEWHDGVPIEQQPLAGIGMRNVG